MSYFITATNTGAVLSTGTVQNPATVGTGVYVTNTTASHGGDAIYGSATYAWTISNYSTVASDPTAGNGIDLVGSGVITNAAATSQISGHVDGVFIAATGIVVNYGTIAATGSYGTGVYFGSGGVVGNRYGGLISAAAGGDGVVVNGSYGTIANGGSITGGNLGVWLEAGGYVNNYGNIAATDAGTGDGVVFGNAGIGVGTLFNNGTITAPDLGVWLEAGGSVHNNGYIIGGSDGVLVSVGTGTVANYGVIDAVGNGVYLKGGGLVRNGGGDFFRALIAGYDGVRLAGPAGTGTLINVATIVSTGTGFGAQAVDFLAGGTLTNYGAILGTGYHASGINAGYADDTIINGSTYNTSATIAGWLNGIDQFSGSGTVINFGTVTSSNGAGVALQAGGYVSNSSSGTIQGYSYGIDVASGAATIVNAGLVHATNAGKSVGILLGGGGTVENFGTIASDGAGNFSGAIDMLATGRVVNVAGALIAGNFDGIEGNSNADFVTNYGMITAHERGVVLFAGGTVVNGAPTLTSASIVATAGTPTNGIDTGYGSAYILNYGTVVGRAGIFGRTGVTTTNHGLISAGRSGVYLSGTSGTVTNTGTITASNSPGYGVLMSLGGTVVNSGLISGLDNGVRFGGGGAYGAARANAGTVLNTGTILASGTGGLGVGLDFGGYLSNGTAGAIAGPDYGVRVGGGPGTVTNSGSIASSNGVGVQLVRGGSFTNNPGGSVSGYSLGVRVGYSEGLYSGRLVNYGRIAATGASYAAGIYFHASGDIDNFGTVTALGGGNGIGVNLKGGTLTNESGALITASGRGVFGYGTAFNAGTIAGANVNGIYADSDVFVSNSVNGLIEGPSQGVAAGGNATIVNRGVIDATGTYGPTGVYVRGIAHVDNFGTVAGTGGTNGNGVNFGSGGTLTNETSGLVTGSADGVRGSSDSVFNLGSIQGGRFAGVGLDGGGYVGNGGGATIYGAEFGVIIGGTISGTVINHGYISAGGGAYPVGIYLGGGGLVDNFDIVSGAAGTGVDFAHGGTVTNEAGGNITAAHVGVSLGGTGYVHNLGAIVASTNGVVVAAAGAPVVNSGTIIGGSNGVYLAAGPSSYSGASVTNTQTGYIEGYDGIRSTQAGANVVNLGTIRGTGGATGVHFAAAGSTLTNAGTITANSGDAVDFTGSNNRLIVKPGAIFYGYRAAYGGGGSNDTLELAAGTTGTVSSSQYSGFDTLQIDAGANWVLSGNATFASTVSDFGTLTNTGNLVAASIIVDPGTMINSGTINNTVTLDGGSYLINSPGTATIAVSGVAVLGINSPNTVANAGTIAGSGTGGVGIDLTSGGTVSNSGTIAGYINGIAIEGLYGSVSNLGTISASRTFGAGIYLAAGGSITNGSALQTGALIIGNNNALSMFNAPGSVTNFGTIAAVGGYGYGVILGAGGTITNFGTILETGYPGTAVELGNGGILVNNPGGVIAGAGGGAYIYNSVGTVSNSGTIVSTNPFNRDGVYLAGGGIVSNSSLIKGLDGVDLRISGTVMNTGTIVGYGSGFVGGVFLGFSYSPGSFLVTNSSLITSTAAGVYMVGAGSVTNSGSGTITGGQRGVGISGVGTVDNSGLIASTGTNGIGVFIATGGTVVNQSGGLISAYHQGIATNVGTLSVVNRGTIVSTQSGTAAGTGLSGVAIATGTAAARIDNFGTITQLQTAGALQASGGGDALQVGGGLIINEMGARITGTAGNAISTSRYGSAVTISNYGTIANSSLYRSNIYIGRGGIVTNHVGGMIFSSNRNAVVFGNSLVSGVDFGSVVNAGVIQSTGTAGGNGVAFQQGGILTNQAGGMISAYRTGVSITGSAGTVTNLGSIQSTGTYFNGVYLGAGGRVLNAAGATIVSGWEGVNAKNQRATVSNYGNIISTSTVINGGSVHGPAVHLAAGGLVVNPTANALIAGYEFGVDIGDIKGVPQAGAIGTIVNYGTISGFGANSALARPAARLGAGGTIVNHGVITSLAASPVSVIGTDGVTVDNFGTISRPSGGTAISLGAGSDLVVLENGSMLSGSIANFASGDAIDFRPVPFATSDTATFDGTTLTVSGGGVSRSVTLTGLPASAVFGLKNDGSGGTDALFVPANGAIVSAGEILQVSAGQTLTNVTVLAGGTLEIDSGGTAIGTTVSSGGKEEVLSGGVDSAAIILSGGEEDVFGSAFATNVGSGGLLVVGAGGGTSGATISGGGEEIVQAGGVDSSAMVLSGGFEDVFGSALSTIVVNGGTQKVEAGGSAIDANLDGVAVQQVFGFAGGTVVSAGDEQLVESGGVASGTVVLSGGLLQVLSGGVASAATILSGGEDQVLSGGLDRATVLSGGFEDVFGSAVGAVVSSGGTLKVESGGVASGTVISSGGNETVLLGGLTIDTVIAGGQAEIQSGGAASGLITFSGTGTLRLDSLATPAATIGGLVAGDAIDETQIGFAASDTATLDASNRLTVSGGGNSATLQFDSSVAGKSFSISDDGSGGTLLTLTNTPPPTTRLFNFIFVYNDGQDYYLGTVADDGSLRFNSNGTPLPYTVGATFPTTAGAYQIIDQITAPQSQPVGTVSVTDYSHNGPGLASVVPQKSTADGTAGLGSESDTLLGTNGLSYAFSSTQEISLGTRQLYGFVYHYADGSSYTGTVAADGTPTVPTETDSAGNVLGVYTIFTDGVTTRAAGTVVVDRFQGNGLSVLVNHSNSAAVDGTAGLGSEAGSVTVKGLILNFSPTNEPTVVDPPPENPIDLAIGATATGAVATLDDNHAYKLTLTAGTHYSFNLDGFDISSSYTLRDPYLQLLDADGNLVQASDDIGGGNWSSEIDYTATTGGIYYLVAGSSPSDGTYTTGSYQIRSSTPQPLAVNTATTGAVNYVGAKSFYSVTLTAGTYYSFNLDGYDISSSYTLRDPYLRLLDLNGNMAAGYSDDISPANWSSEIDYKAPIDGTYYLEASSSPSDSTYTTGDYQIRSSTPQSLAIGTTATGAIGYVGAKNLYSVNLTAGTHYSFNLDGFDVSSSYTLRDPYLQLLDSNGNVVTANDDIGGGNWSSEIDYTADTGGTYYLRASSSPSDGTYTTGSYQIRAVTVPPAAGSAAAAGLAGGGGSGATIVPVSGDQTVTATGRPEIFDFSSLSFGNDTIAGFDPAQDAIRLSSSLAGNYAALQSDMSATAAGTLITLDKTHSIALSGVAPNSLTAGNFRFV